MGNGETVRMEVQYMSRGRERTGVTEILKMRAGSTGETESEVGVACVSRCHIKSSKETLWDVSLLLLRSSSFCKQAALTKGRGFLRPYRPSRNNMARVAQGKNV